MKPGENPAFSIPNSPEKSQIKKKNKEKSLSVSSPITTFDYSEVLNIFFTISILY